MSKVKTPVKPNPEDYLLSYRCNRYSIDMTEYANYIETREFITIDKLRSHLYAARGSCKQAGATVAIDEINVALTYLDNTYGKE